VQHRRPAGAPTVGTTSPEPRQGFKPFAAGVGQLAQHDALEPIDHHTPLSERIEAVDEFVGIALLHFSAGEIMQRGWGHRSGLLITDKPEFREHLASFALDQLWRLLVKTWEVTGSFLDASGISSDENLTVDELEPTLNRLLATGRVPFVHAAEWGVTPEGPLPLPRSNG
jgi:hypothetical protein